MHKHLDHSQRKELQTVMVARHCSISVRKNGDSKDFDSTNQPKAKRIHDHLSSTENV